MSNVTLPNDGRVKEGGWGANLDPNNWTVTSMTNEPTLFKVVDSNKVNVADRFQVQANAQQFIDYHKSKQAECGEGKRWNYLKNECEGITIIGGTGGLDKFQVKEIYPTKDGGVEVYMAIITQDKGTEGDYYQELNRIRHISGEETSSNDMHFLKGIVDVEATGYFKFVKNMDDVDVKLRGGHHSGDGEPDSARCYIFRVNESGFGKEYPHDDGKGYSWTKPPKLPTEFNLDFGSLQGKWIGFKGITLNEGDKVRCEMWIDTDGVDSNGQFDQSRQNWRRWYNILDEDGKYGEDTDKHKTRKVWTTLQQHSTVQFRVDAENGKKMTYRSSNGADATFKFLSAREIKK